MDVARKKRENVGIFKKQGEGRSTRIQLPFFTVVNMGDPPTINVPGPNNHNFFSLTNMSFPNRGEGGVPYLGKIPTFSRFFFGNVPKVSSRTIKFKRINFLLNTALDFGFLKPYNCNIHAHILLKYNSGGVSCYCNCGVGEDVCHFTNCVPRPLIVFSAWPCPNQ